MNLDEKLIELLDKTMNGLEQGGEFLAAELPEVVTQLLLWYGVYNFIMFVTGIFIAIVIYKFAIKALTKKHAPNWMYTKVNDKIDTHEDPRVLLPIVVSGLAMIISLYAINLTWLKIWIAPKIWLIEYTAELANSVAK